MRRGGAGGTRRRTLLAAPALLVGPARAQEGWPDRPLRFVVSAQVGGVSDILVRIFEARLRERLGQPLYVDPRPGAGGQIAAESVIRPQDGHSLLVNHIAGHGIGPSLHRNRSYDPLRDMPGVVRLCAMPNVLITRGALPVRSVAELVAHIRANPRAATFSSAGSGTSSHLSGLLFGQIMGVEVTHVPYRGTAPSMLAVLNGEVLFNIDNAPVSRPHVVSGALRAIGVSTAKRAAAMPDLPTLAEQGVTGFDVASWYGIAAPAAMPPPVVARLEAVFLEALRDPGIHARLAEIGAEPWPLGTAAYNAFMRAEVARWAPVVAASGATVD
ncbi:Bug family tripartite tricarboxylate transporter substrate binding protein [Paracraurococcus ruber]|nr:tripartite tricarboxylate transporter substrate-binding protein [Paracraurococcus ruber]